MALNSSFIGAPPKPVGIAWFRRSHAASVDGNAGISLGAQVAGSQARPGNAGVRWVKGVWNLAGTAADGHLRRWRDRVRSRSTPRVALHTRGSVTAAV